MKYSTEHLMACEECDLLLEQDKPPEGHSVICPRCGNCIDKSLFRSLSNTLSLSVTGLFLFVPAVLLSLFTFESVGVTDSCNVLESIVIFMKSGYDLVGISLLFAAVLFPFFLLLCTSTLSFCLISKKYPSWLARLFRFYIHIEEWAMVEVYLLGMIITIIKMRATAEINYDMGFIVYIFLVLLVVGVNGVLDRSLFWRLLEYKGEIPEAPFPLDADVTGERLVTPQRISLIAGDVTTAAEKGLILCHDCHKLIPIADHSVRCPRCGARLHLRKQESLSRTWALIVCSFVLLVPANLLPIMRVNFLGIPSYSTIMDGIRFFFEEGSFLIGIIILTASVLVPVFKVVNLAILLLTIRFKSTENLREKAIMFRYVSFIGRWSMLDVFVIGLLSASVDFGFFTSVGAAPAIMYFCILVIVTMFAVISFDPRLMWDVCQPWSANRQNISSLDVKSKR